MPSFLHRYELARQDVNTPTADGFAPVRDAIAEIAGKVLRTGPDESRPIGAVDSTAFTALIPLPSSDAKSLPSSIFLEFARGAYYAAVSPGPYFEGRPAVMHNAAWFETSDEM